MRQKIFYLVLPLIALLAGGSCTLPGGPDFEKGTLTLLFPESPVQGDPVYSKAPGISRSVLSDSFIDTLVYRLTFTRSTGSDVFLEAGGGGTTVTLDVGRWTVEAAAYAPGEPTTPVGSGSVPITVIAGQNGSIRIPMQVDPVYEAELTEIFIHNEAELRRVGAAENGLAISGAGRTFYLEDDIALTQAWTPIGGPGDPFKAVFDGQGHTVTVKSFSGAKKADNAVLLGFFALVEGAAIKNITVKYELEGPVDISTGDGSTHNSYAGGVAGSADNSSFKNIHVAGNFSVKADGNGELNVGGIAGKTGGSTGSVITASYAAGIVEGITSGGNVYSGGIAGSTGGKDRVENCYVWAAVSSGAVTKETAGGIAGTNDGTISKCYAAGTVQSKGTNPAVYIGGIAGHGDGTVRACASLVSKLDGGSSTSKNVSAISGYGTLSGNYSRTSIIYNRTDSPGLGANAKDGEGKPLAGFKAQALYAGAGWDFTAETGVWKFLPDCDYPVLSWQTAAPQSGLEEAPEGGIEIGWL
ncbi:MAG: FapA family protein [Treponema sp.]|jgi:hypothetical protein|nr:FapA family protein [Treponema sp.]